LAAKELKLPTVLKFLIKNNDRNYKIIDQVFQAVCSKSQRKVIILSDRLEHLKILQEILNKEANKHKIQVTSDFYIGARRKDELDEAVKAQVIFATYSMAQEALDIPAIDTLMLVTPRSDVEQAIGRIRRWCIPENGKCTKDLCMWKRDTCKGKPQTIIVDFIDDERNCQKKFASRMFLYRKLGISIGTE
jgi:superfamily II DNA or RNA helicase